ncbi:MAG: beta-lactamase family protein [Gemmatimonadota bacterium]|nr:beta-lactamase family protein [Gemmatimonadota bacterium]
MTGTRSRPWRGLVALGCLACTAASAGAQASPAAPAGWDDFARDLRAYVAADGIVGASALVMREGRVLARVDVGEQDRAGHVAATDRTIYHWGSITKALTAISIMQLRDRGRLSLDDRITRYLPELRLLHDPYGMIDSITIRMLLSHSAGFRNGTWPYAQGRPWEPFEPTTWAQLVAMMPYQELLFRPGTRYGYSNPAFIYLARVIEQLSGDPWDAYVQKNIFAPLGITHSYFRGTPYWLAADRSHNYTIVRDSATGAPRTVDNGADFDPGITTPNGGWNAPLQDLATYVAFLTDAVPLGGSRANYPHVLSRASLEEMWTPVVPMDAGYEASSGQWMGLSFFLRRNGSQRLIGHTGSQAGFRSFFYFDPATGAAIIAVFNTTNQAAPATAAYEKLTARALALLR